jgi:D-glycero-alpha-D-manno-heptose-7-phosphate kinase
MIITRAPLRISFLGGGTDYPEYFTVEGGAVLATAIDQYAYITANHFHSELFDYSIRIAYRKVELAHSLDDIQHIPFREALRHCGVTRDIELNYMADLPAFTGLGSSSSFTVALLQALHAYCGRYRSGLELAYQAIHLERHILGDRVGCQDQVLAAVGGFNLIEFRAEDDILVHRLALSPQRIQELQCHLLLFFTGIRRSASEVAGKQIQKISENRATLRQMHALVERGFDVLISGRPVSEFGELLHRGWLLKRSLDQGVTCANIDAMYARARAAGAIGGKLLGAGGGGFLLIVARPEDQPRIRAEMAEFPTLNVSLAASGSQLSQGDRPFPEQKEIYVGTIAGRDHPNPPTYPA